MASLRRAILSSRKIYSSEQATAYLAADKNDISDAGCDANTCSHRILSLPEDGTFNDPPALKTSLDQKGTSNGISS